MEAALVGDYRPEHLFVLGQSLQACRFYQARTQECDAQIESHLQQLAERFESSSALGAGLSEPEVPTVAPSQNPPSIKRKVKRKPQANEPKIDLVGYLRRICGVDLTQVIGLNVLSVLLIVSEIGVDMSKWRSAKVAIRGHNMGLGTKNRLKQTADICKGHLREKYRTGGIWRKNLLWRLRVRLMTAKSLVGAGSPTSKRDAQGP